MILKLLLSIHDVDVYKNFDEYSLDKENTFLMI